MNKRCLALPCGVAMLMAWPLTGFAQELELIQLHHRSADSLLPVLTPLLERGSVLTGTEDKLFLRASPQNSAVLRKAIIELDREPRRLLVSVRQSNDSTGAERNVAAGARLETRESSGLQPDRSGVQLRTGKSDSANVGTSISQVQVLEGYGALIAVGSSVPIVSPFQAAPGGAVIPSSTTYRELRSGSYVVPRIVGEQVILEISQQTQVPQSSAEGVVDTRSLSTTVSAPLGVWINLGGSGESQDAGQRRSNASRLETRQDVQTLWIKVEVQ